MVKVRGNSFQADFRFKGSRYRKSFPTALEASTWETWAKDQLSKGLPLEDATPAQGLTMKGLLEATTQRYWKGAKAEHSSVACAEEVVELLGETRHPGTVTTAVIDELVGKLSKKGNGPATINRKLSALSKMLTHAATRGMIQSKPHIEKKKETTGRVRWYSHEEEKYILDWFNELDDHIYRDLLSFLADTGARLGEALRLEARDCSDVYVAFHETKGGKPRSVPITQRVRDILARIRPASPTGLVFGSVVLGNLYYHWDRMKKSSPFADDPQAVIHTFRHTCASRLVQGGTPIQVVQQWLGHTTLTMTLRYAYLAPANLLSAVNALEPKTPGFRLDTGTG